MDGNKTFRVYNKCNYDIGITLMSGQAPVIKNGSFLVLTVNDILFIESTARRRRPFSSGELVPVNDEGKPMSLQDLGGYEDPNVVKHYTDEEITANLKKSVKNIEAWLETIDDPAEMHAVCVVAEQMDLPASKMKVIQKFVPNIDLLDE